MKTATLESRSQGLGLDWHWSRWVPVVTLLVIFVFFSFSSDAFLTTRNLTNLARQVSVNCILGFGMTLIILLGGVDLSVGSVLALGTVVAGLLQVDGGLNAYGVGGALTTIAAVFAVCGLVAAISGFLTAKFKMPAFVVTLGLLVMARGAAMILSGGGKISPLSSELRWMGTAFVSPQWSIWLLVLVGLSLSAFFILHHFRVSKNILKTSLTLITLWFLLGAAGFVFGNDRGVPLPVVWMGLVFGAIYFVLNRTVFGRAVYAVGGNKEAARLCGISVQRVWFFVFVIMGLLVALASLIEGTRIDAGDPNAGNLYELDAIAAVVIGGTSLQGGVGTVQGTLLGAMLMGSVNNGMSLMNIPTHYQMVIKGLIIIGAVLMDVVSKKSEGAYA